MKLSIVIPAYGSVKLLDECLASLHRNTDLSDIEIIVVCNGTDEHSPQLVMNNNHRLVWCREPVGFTKAANMGFKLATAPVTLIMNTDAQILDYWPIDLWVEHLLKSFNNDNVGIAGLGIMNSEWGPYLPFYFAAIRTKLFEEIGYLDEDFSPGYAEDLDFTIRTRNAGYDIVSLDNGRQDHDRRMVIASYPIFHKGEQSFTDKEIRYQCLVNAHEVLKRKWGVGSPLLP